MRLQKALSAGRCDREPARAAATCMPRGFLTMRPTLFPNLLGGSSIRAAASWRSGRLDLDASIRAAAFSLSKRARMMSPRKAPRMRAQSRFVRPCHPGDCKHGSYRPCPFGPVLSPQLSLLWLNAQRRRVGLGTLAKLNIAASKEITTLSHRDSDRCRSPQPIVTLESKCSHFLRRGSTSRLGKAHTAHLPVK